jgi:hypothetical protein
MRDDTDDRIVDVRALWQSDQTDLRRLSPAELDAKVARMGRALRVATYGLWVICAIEIVAFTAFFFQPGGLLRKAGALLTVAGMTFLAIQIRFLFVRMRRYQEAMLAEPSVVFYRAWLEQVRSWSQGRWFWSRFLALLPGPLLFSFDVGRGAAHGLAGYTSFIVFIVLFLSAIVLNVVVAVRLVNKRLTLLASFAKDD